jgi:hypothetical protein
LREIIDADPYPNRHTIPMLLQIVFRDIGYWQKAGQFGFVEHPETGQMVLQLPVLHEDGTPKSLTRTDALWLVEASRPGHSRCCQDCCQPGVRHQGNPHHCQGC